MRPRLLPVLFSLPLAFGFACHRSAPTPTSTSNAREVREAGDQPAIASRDDDDDGDGDDGAFLPIHPGDPVRPQRPDRELRGILRAIDRHNLENTIQMLTSF